MRTFYLIAAIIGAVWPLSSFLPWLIANGPDVTQMLRLAAANPISSFGWADVLVSGIVCLGLISIEGRRTGMKRLWVPVLGICCVGVSFGLPLFLWMRERHLKTAG